MFKINDLLLGTAYKKLWGNWMMCTKNTCWGKEFQNENIEIQGE